MRKNYILFIIVLLLLFPFISKGHLVNEPVSYKLDVPDLDVPQLIFTEFRGDAPNNTYVEITNIGDEPIDISNFAIISGHMFTKMQGSTETEIQLRLSYGYVPLSGILQQGESYVVSSAWDAMVESAAIPWHNVGIAQKSDLVCHWPEEESVEGYVDAPEYEAYGRDSADYYYPYTPTHPDAFGSQGFYLQYAYIDSLGNRDSTIVDNVNFSIDPYERGGSMWGQGSYQTPVAGVEDAIDSYILVRKSSIKEGNTNWHLSRGTNDITSDWIVVPEFNDKFNAFTTIGNHGDFDIDYSIVNDKISVDEANATITVPWEIARGEALAGYFDFGDGMAWSFDENTADSVYTNIQDGDIFSMYALGDNLKEMELTVNVTAPTSDVAIAFPKRIYSNSVSSIMPGNAVDVIGDEEPFKWRNLFQITDGLELDSIYNIPHGTSVDTLMKYIYVPEKASAEVVLQGGQERTNLKKGDKFIVTSENGEKVKEYLIEVRDYMPSTNAKLGMISWPEYNPNVYWEWTSDTIPDFSPNTFSYTIKIDDNTSQIPALQFKPLNNNATVEVCRAIDINGTIEQRTTTAKVIAEDGISTNIYKVKFELQSVDQQPNIAEPFISEFMLGWIYAYGTEIYNPGSVDLDLDGYMLLNGDADQNLAEALAASTESDEIYRYVYAFGKRFKNDESAEAFAAEPGFLVSDDVTNTIVKPNDVFVLGTLNDYSWPGGKKSDKEGFVAVYEHFRDVLDMTFYGWSFQHDNSSPTDSINDEFNLHSWGIKQHRYKNPSVIGFTSYGGRSYNSIFLLKIENDSVTNGSKNIYDPEDYTIVDRFQKDPETDKFYLSGIDLRDPSWNRWSITRHSDVWRGVTEPGEGIGDDMGRLADNSQWEIYHNTNRPEGVGGNEIFESIGSHAMDPVTNYLSTVTSLTFDVTPGYEGELSITGDMNGLTVETFIEQLDKSDETQILKVYNADSDVLSQNDPVANGFMLKVSSGNGRNVTMYNIIDSPLSDDNLLKVKDGAGLSVSMSGTEGVVSNVALGVTIKSILDDLIVPSTAVLNVIDNNDNLIPLMAMNFDSVMADVYAGSNILFEVVAENGDIALYSLDFDVSDSDAILMSNILNVDQKMRLVVGMPKGLNISRLNKFVFANEGSVIKVVDKYGFERNSGILNFDDEIVVTSADESSSKSYKMKFVGKSLVGQIMANVTFIVDDTKDEYPEGFMLKGSWNGVTGEFDGEWDGQKEHTALYDDGTHGDATANDNIWTVTIELAVDNGENTWEWGFNNKSGQNVNSGNIQFALENADDVVTTYTIGANSIESYGKNFRIYPNPVKSELSIIGIDVYSVQVYNIAGVKMNVEMTDNKKINVRNLNDGVYVLKIIEKNGVSSLAKFVKK